MPAPAPPPESDPDAALLRFLHLAGELKRTRRAGWALRGVPAAESVADHSWRMALLALLLAPRAGPEVEVARCVALALVHDLAEAVVGDITPFDGISAEDKRAREEAAMHHLSALAGDETLLELWREYDAGESPEARLVKELDRLETVLQAAEYAAEPAPGQLPLDEFWGAARERIRSQPAAGLLAALERARRADGGA
jgi:putative hydrolase of HD superfamily